MRDPNAAAKRRDEMAKAAAPFLHSKLSSIENQGLNEEPEITGLEVVFVLPPRRFEDLEANVRFRGRYWGQSGHDLVHCTRPLMTQSGHQGTHAHLPF